jgi:hypothetical protein
MFRDHLFLQVSSTKSVQAEKMWEQFYFKSMVVPGKSSDFKNSLNNSDEYNSIIL